MTRSGYRQVLGLWIEQSEGAKFWLRVMNEIQGRATQDILIALVHGLKSFSERSLPWSRTPSFRRGLFT
jgi:transposase-like protein